MGQARRKLNMYDPTVFRICIEGGLDQHWCEYFSAQSASVTYDDAGNTVTTLVSEPMDQGALVGLLSRLNALGIPVISVESVPSN